MVIERDRSNELYDLFRQCTSSQARRQEAPLHSSNEVQTFNRFAQGVSRDIAAVSDKIMQLAKVARNQSVFDDQTAVISGLASSVKTSLQKLHDDMDTLETLKTQSLASQRGTGGNNLFRGNALKTSQKHNETVIDTLKSRLASTGQTFRTTLQSQSKTLRSNANRRFQFTSSDQPQSFESALFQEQEQQQQQQQLMSGNTNTQYYRQRLDAVRELEAAVAEVGEMFSDFARLTHEQEDVVLRIDVDVDRALENVNAGSNELIRYLSNISSNRGLILKIFAILFFFLMFFGFFVVH
ncbi:syntaxin 5 [Strigomonas culicis]|uniref:Syntaxin 5 n=1 Tax=Strigomonas culicis TaxID=28005 RepID=S9UV62_9TRYP|nr:syntaxin 5 [Strigomonas culicis]|eukprot:EPY32793.1 syntaxin 5 [Strigomonas culicis]